MGQASLLVTERVAAWGGLIECCSCSCVGLIVAVVQLGIPIPQLRHALAHCSSNVSGKGSGE